MSHRRSIGSNTIPIVIIIAVDVAIVNIVILSFKMHFPRFPLKTNLFLKKVLSLSQTKNKNKNSSISQTIYRLRGNIRVTFVEAKMSLRTIRL